jgi:hypothetical protein
MPTRRRESPQGDVTLWVQSSVSKTRGIPAVNMSAAHYCQVRRETTKLGNMVILYARFDEVAIPLVEVEVIGENDSTATDSIYSILEQILKAMAAGERFLDLRKLQPK